MNKKTIVKELKIIIEKLGHFPTHTELVKTGRSDLAYKIRKNKGFLHFRELLGFEPLRKTKTYPHRRDYWNEETILKELKEIIKEINDFPTANKLEEMGKGNLSVAISNNEGFPYFRELLGFEPLRKRNVFQTEEKIIAELRLIKKELDHFPKQTELVEMKRYDLLKAINKHNGLNHFRELLRCELLKKPNGYWIEENILKELEFMIKKLKHFPIATELVKTGKSDLANAISNNGGYNYFRELLGYELTQKPAGYWNKEIIFKKLSFIIKEIGHFPSRSELKETGENDLLTAVLRYGGYNYFKKEMGHKLTQKTAGYWNEEIIITELKPIIEEIGDFPTANELRKMNKGDLVNAIQKNNGFLYYWEIFNIDITEKIKIRSEKASYNGKKGYNSEKIVKEFIIKWCYAHNFPQPNLNVKLAKSKIIEFVCETDKRIGIDVTNIEGKNGNGIRRKWYHKEYQNHLDELWIVVFNNDYNFDDYIKLNEKSPDNVKVMSIFTFIRELDITIDENLKFKIDVYNQCTFHTKEELKALMSEKNH